MRSSLQNIRKPQISVRRLLLYSPRSFIFVIGRRLGKNVDSETATKVANYKSKLTKLIGELRDGILLNIQYGVQQTETREDLRLGFLACASNVGLNRAKCLDGTRAEILNEIVDWINNTDTCVPPIFWLHGQAGKGKSAIAHTIALYARNLGILGSYFCFTRVRQREGLHTKLFPTIARDLADRDLRLRPLLAKVIKDPSLGNTSDVSKQWYKFIVEPLSQLQGSLTGNVVIVIDALDESGAKATRASILKALTENDGKPPANIRILLTSRPLIDFHQALNVPHHVYTRSLDDFDTELTISDIRLYVSYRLRGGNFSDEDLRRLAAKSNGVFEWARLACDFISHRVRATAKQRMEEILSQALGNGGTLLDEMYTTFLKEFVPGSSEMSVMFQSVMRQILWSMEPLSISTLDFMRDKFPQVDDRRPVGGTLRMMAPLLSGTDEISTPICPLHASFYDFLLDEERSREFSIQQGDVHRDLAFASLSVMSTCLCFNICGLATSSVPNAEIADLHRKVKENIPPYLLYACRFWATHLQEAEFEVELAKLVCQFITGEQILFWLEALGVSKLIREAYWALISAEKWFQVRYSVVSLKVVISMTK